MPLSGIVIRLTTEAHSASIREQLARIACVELGDAHEHALAAVIDAPDYPAHDGALKATCELSGVCAVDVVFHDFSDTSEFPRMPKKQGSNR